MTDAERPRPILRKTEKLALLPEEALDPALMAKRVLPNLFAFERRTVDYVDNDGEKQTLDGFLNFERGDAVAILPYDTEKAFVVLVEQVRAPVLEKTETGWLIETVAGMPKRDPAETLLDCVVRELEEETGIRLPADPEEIRRRVSPLDPADPTRSTLRFFSSPGGTSEQIHVFLADVTGLDQGRMIAGNLDEDERIHVVRTPFETFFEKLDAGAYHDPKILIAAQKLRTTRRELIDRRPADARYRAYEIRREGAATIELGLAKGDMMDHPDLFDVWVNSEDPRLTMARPFESTVSGMIRRGSSVWSVEDPEGARAADHQRHDGPQGSFAQYYGDQVEDPVADELALLKNQRGREVDLGDVFLTTSGRLAHTCGVRRIAHVVAVSLGSSLKQKAHPELACDFVAAALREIDEANRQSGLQRLVGLRKPYASVLMPLFGTGSGGGK
ncbi:MAG: NUDIX domain-containing protein, partial [Pseudomonadota bacterium]